MIEKRVYVIEYDIELNRLGSAFSINSEYEHRTEFYSKMDRDDFIKRYIALTKPDKWNIDNVKCYTAKLEEIEDMDKVVNAI